VKSIEACFKWSSLGSSNVQEDYSDVLSEKNIFTLADGFGGQSYGDKAAQRVCEAAIDFIKKESGDIEATLPFVRKTYYSLEQNVLYNALIHANRTLLADNQKKQIFQKGGASILTAVIKQDWLTLAGVGTCSAWLFREDKQIPLLLEDSYLAVEGQTARQWNLPNVALGLTSDFEPKLTEHQVHSGDWIMFQTDGVTQEMRQRAFTYIQGHEGELKSKEDVFDGLRRGLEGIPSADNSMFLLIKI